MNSKKNINGHLDLFSGIGGFSLGLKQAGIESNWTGFSDIDKYANETFKRRFPNAEELGPIENISYESLKGKRLDLLTGGFPCQAFSIAGRRKGFNDTRGTLFFEIERILRDYIERGKPIPIFLLENVKGLYSHDNKRTFTTIYKILTDLDYTIECQVVNTKWWLSTPQNRERIYIFGRYNGNRCGRKVFPIYGDAREVEGKKIDVVANIAKSGGQRGDVHSPNGIISCLCSTDYKEPKKIIVHSTQQRGAKRPSLTKICDCGSKKLYQKCCGVPGGSGPLSKEDGSTYCLDSQNSQAVETTRSKLNQIGTVCKGDGGRVFDSNGVACTLKSLGGGLGAKTGLYRVDDINLIAKKRTYDTPIDSVVVVKYKSKALNETLEQNDLKEDDVKALDLYNRKAQDIAPTLKNPNHADLRLFQGKKTLNKNQIKKEMTGRIRKLTPIECERLQGFPDNWTEGHSDTQRYKQVGNAVSVNVVKSIMEKIYQE